MHPQRRAQRERTQFVSADEVPSYLIRFDATENAVKIAGPKRHEIEWFRAVNEENVDAMVSLLEKGVDANAENKEKDTALQVSIKKNNLRMLSLLMQHRVDVNAHIGIHRETPLIFASRYGRHECVRMLCQSPEVDVNTSDASGMSAMAYAAQFGQLSVMQVLLEFGADINRKDDRGDTPLSVSAYHGRIDSLRFLVERGANVETVDISGNSPIQAAIDGGHYDCAQYLRVKLAEFVSDKVWVAARDNDVSALMTLLEGGRNADDVGIRGNQVAPLIWACQNGHAEAVQILLKHKASTEVIGPKNNWTPLFYAMEAKAISCIHHLVAAGANIRALASNGDTLLHLAARIDYEDVVGLLVDKGLLPDHANFNGETPLSIAQVASKIDDGTKASIVRHPRAMWLAFSSIAQILARYHSKSRRFRHRYQLKDERHDLYGHIAESAVDFKRSKQCVLKFMQGFEEFQRQTSIYDRGLFDRYVCPMSENFVDGSLHTANPYCIVVDVGEDNFVDRSKKIQLEVYEVKALLDKVLQFCTLLTQQGLGLVHIGLDKLHYFWDGSYRLFTVDAIHNLNQPLSANLVSSLASEYPEIKEKARTVDMKMCTWAYGVFLKKVTKLIKDSHTLLVSKREENVETVDEMSVLISGCENLISKIFAGTTVPPPLLTELQDHPFFSNKLHVELATDGNFPAQLDEFLTIIDAQSSLDRPRLPILSLSSRFNWAMPLSWTTWVSHISKPGYIDIHFLCEESLHTIRSEPGHQVRENRSFWSSILLLSGLVLFWAKRASSHVPFLLDDLFPRTIASAEDVRRVILLEFPELMDLMDDRPLSPATMALLMRKAAESVWRLDAYLDNAPHSRRNSNLFPVKTSKGQRWFCLEHTKKYLKMKEVEAQDVKTSANDHIQQISAEIEERIRLKKQQLEEMKSSHKEKLDGIKEKLEQLDQDVKEKQTAQRQKEDEIAQVEKATQDCVEKTKMLEQELKDIISDKEMLEAAISRATLKIEEGDKINLEIVELEKEVTSMEASAADQSQAISAKMQEFEAMMQAGTQGDPSSNRQKNPNP
eukprot:TRINITY_DN9294_c0_g1_i1.p1 TRINITY_DN9294_c0_g1~~TRINITY_DN9294_c0_g1_i1.p1  ORF type:complete len:1056 (+),score=235.02 TRINITY_DN9294_c0_g1_i1:54-3221(+)